MKTRCISFFLAAITVLLLSTEACSKSPTVLKAVVADKFYPGDKEILNAMVEKYLKDATPAPVEGHIFGLISPHAGYQYSGPVAGNAFKLIQGKKYSTVVVMAPSHHVGFEGIALANKDFYETPLGKIKNAKDLSEKLAQKFSWAKDDPRPYSVEHSLEVELPFLQATLKDFKLLPIIVGVCNSEMLVQLAKALNDMLPGDDVLFVSSSDLSHYHPYIDAVARDKKTIELIENMSVLGDAELCGNFPVQVLIEIAKLRHGKAKLIKYANSGDTTGDKSRVVGYAAIAFVGEKEEGGMTNEEKTTLLKIARSSIEALVLKKPQPTFDIKDPELLKNGAAFVTIRKRGQLRGCIGHIIAMEPLYKSVWNNALAAASEDPRFNPVRPDELKEIDLEISVLTQPEPLANPMEVRVGTDGLIIQKGFHRGVLLPQVPTELGWNKDRFLEGICEKAGLPPGAWKDATLSRFQAIVFHE